MQSWDFLWWAFGIVTWIHTQADFADKRGVCSWCWRESLKGFSLVVLMPVAVTVHILAWDKPLHESNLDIKKINLIIWNTWVCYPEAGWHVGTLRPWICGMEVKKQWLQLQKLQGFQPAFLGVYLVRQGKQWLLVGSGCDAEASWRSQSRQFCHWGDTRCTETLRITKAGFTYACDVCCPYACGYTITMQQITLRYFVCMCPVLFFKRTYDGFKNQCVREGLGQRKNSKKGTRGVKLKIACSVSGLTNTTGVDHQFGSILPAAKTKKRFSRLVSRESTSPQHAWTGGWCCGQGPGSGHGCQSLLEAEQSHEPLWQNRICLCVPFVLTAEVLLMLKGNNPDYQLFVAFSCFRVILQTTWNLYIMKKCKWSSRFFCWAPK